MNADGFDINAYHQISNGLDVPMPSIQLFDGRELVFERVVALDDANKPVAIQAYWDGNAWYVPHPLDHKDDARFCERMWGKRRRFEIRKTFHLAKEDLDQISKVTWLMSHRCYGADLSDDDT